MKYAWLLITVLFCSVNAGAQNKTDTRFVTATPSVDTSIYASGDVIGGLLTFTASVGSAVGSGLLVGATVKDKSGQSAPLTLWLFDSNPSNSTFTDQAAFALSDSDLSKSIGFITFGSSSVVTSTLNSLHHVNTLAMPVRARTSGGAASGVLYGVLVSAGTPTFGTSSDVSVQLEIISD